MKKPAIKTKLPKRFEAKYIGDEPEFEEGYTPTKGEMVRALSWYNQTLEIKDLIDQFLKVYPPIRSDLKTATKNKSSIKPTYASLGIILARHPWIGGEYFQQLSNHLDEICRIIKEEEPSEERKNVPNVQGYMRAALEPKLVEFDVAIDNLIRNGEKFDVGAWMSREAFSPQQRAIIVKIYAEMLEEYKGISKNEELKEGYSNLSNKTLRAVIELLESLGTAEIVKVRRERKAKVAPIKPTVQKKISKDPFEVIVGKSVAYFFDTSYNILRRYVALKGKTLDFNGKRVLNFDDKLSEGKKIRKPKEFFDSIARKTEKVMEFKFKELKTKPSALSGMLKRVDLIGAY